MRYVVGGGGATASKYCSLHVDVNRKNALDLFYSLTNKWKIDPLKFIEFLDYLV